MINEDWKEFDFSTYDVLYHVVGTVHADVGHVSNIEAYLKAKAEGVKQFIFMPSIIVYNVCQETFSY